MGVFHKKKCESYRKDCVLEVYVIKIYLKENFKQFF